MEGRGGVQLLAVPLLHGYRGWGQGKACSDWMEQWDGVVSNSLLSHYNTAIVGRGKVRHAVTGWSSGMGSSSMLSHDNTAIVGRGKVRRAVTGWSSGMGSSSMLSHDNTAIVGRGKVRRAVTGWSSGMGSNSMLSHDNTAIVGRGKVRRAVTGWSSAMGSNSMLCLLLESFDCCPSGNLSGLGTKKQYCQSSCICLISRSYTLCRVQTASHTTCVIKGCPSTTG